jgi:hypothetical protein
MDLSSETDAYDSSSGPSGLIIGERWGEYVFCIGRGGGGTHSLIRICKCDALEREVDLELGSIFPDTRLA